LFYKENTLCKKSIPDRPESVGAAGCELLGVSNRSFTRL